MYSNNKTEHLYTSHKTISTHEQYQHVITSISNRFIFIKI